MDRYPNISDHGLIGDLQTAALVTTDGCVDWFCCPRFDSPSVFGALLDADNGGYFQIKPDRDDYVSKQLYFPDTAMLITRFMTPDGVGEVRDFMPVAGQRATSQHRLVRLIRVVRGTMRFVGDIKPRFDYGRKQHKLEVTDEGAVFHSDDLELTVHTIGHRGTSRPTWGPSSSGSVRTCACTGRSRRARAPGWCWSGWAAGRGGCPRVPSTSSPTRPPGTGGTGCAGPPTPAAGARW